MERDQTVGRRRLKVKMVTQNVWTLSLKVPRMAGKDGGVEPGQKETH